MAASSQIAPTGHHVGGNQRCRDVPCGASPTKRAGKQWNPPRGLRRVARAWRGRACRSEARGDIWWDSLMVGSAVSRMPHVMYADGVCTGFYSTGVSGSSLCTKVASMEHVLSQVQDKSDSVHTLLPGPFCGQSVVSRDAKAKVMQEIAGHERNGQLHRLQAARKNKTREI
eukprot:gene10033-biopygen3765